MESLLHTSEEDRRAAHLSSQAIWFTLHTVLALMVWMGLMLAGYAINPPSVSQTAILLFSVFVPLFAGYIVNRFRQDEMATLVWLVGLTWILVVSLWILDMPTGPNACFQCDATEKMARTFFSIPRPSGLIDNDGPFLGTWPAAALVGYAIGARLAMRKRIVLDE